MTTNFDTLIPIWKTKYDILMNLAISPQALEQARVEFPGMPGRLIELLKISNGFSLNWFVVFPLEDDKNIKKTWNGLMRNNSKLENYPPGFFAFASLGEGNLAYICKTDGSLWYDDVEGLVETSATLEEFIEACLKDAMA